MSAAADLHFEDVGVGRSVGRVAPGHIAVIEREAAPERPDLMSQTCPAVLAEVKSSSSTARVPGYTDVTVPEMSPMFVEEHTAEILAATGYQSLLHLVRAYGTDRHARDGTEAVNMAVDSCLRRQAGADRLAMLAELLNMHGTPALKTSLMRPGEDTVETLIYLPDPGACGLDPHDQDACMSYLGHQAAAYTAWLCGDVYGFELFEVDADQEPLAWYTEQYPYATAIDSCGGFYGNDLVHSGIAAALQAASAPSADGPGA